MANNLYPRQADSSELLHQNPNKFHLNKLSPRDILLKRIWFTLACTYPIEDILMPKPIPPGAHTLTPTITVHNAVEAIEFYKKAFDATEESRYLAPDGKIMHAKLNIGDSGLMISDENPNWQVKSPKTLGGTPSGIYMYVENVDEVFDRAVKAGAQVMMPLMNQFWGDRMAVVLDPYGHKWSLATHVEDLTHEEIKKRGEAFMKQMAGAKN
jgi:PhnB protein